jgi:hypothetical protein
MERLYCARSDGKEPDLFLWAHPVEIEIVKGRESDGN